MFRKVDDAAQDMSHRVRLLRELNAVLHALRRADDPRIHLVLSAARVYLENELRRLDGQRS